MKELLIYAAMIIIGFGIAEYKARQFEKKINQE